MLKTFETTRQIYMIQLSPRFRSLAALRLLIIIFALGLGSASTAQAELLKIGFANLYETRELNLAPGETGDVTVYVSSAGDLVDGFKVYIVRDSDKRPLASGISDDQGVIRFVGVPPGSYTLVLSKTRKQAIRDMSVFLGDATLSVSRRPPVKAPAEPAK